MARKVLFTCFAILASTGLALSGARPAIAESGSDDAMLDLSGAWTVGGTIARAPAIGTSAGAPASLEVRCDGEPDVVLKHPALSTLPVEREDRRPGWFGNVQVILGWGLDLRNPTHVGARTYWFPCEGDPSCVVPAPGAREWTLEKLKSSFTLYIRIQPPQGSNVDLQVSLTGSRRAIETACGETPDGQRN